MTDNDELLRRALSILDNVLPMVEDVEPDGECDIADGDPDADLCANWQCQNAGCAVLKARQIRKLLSDAGRPADEFIEGGHRPMTRRETDEMLRTMSEERASR